MAAAEKYQAKAKQAFDEQNYKTAIKYFNKIKIGRHNSWIYADRAIAKMRIKDYEGAVQDFDRMQAIEKKEVYEKLKKECCDMINQRII